MLPQAAAHRTDGWCAWCPAACCDPPPVYPASHTHTHTHTHVRMAHIRIIRVCVRGILTDLEMALITLEKPTASFSSSCNTHSVSHATFIQRSCDWTHTHTHTHTPALSAASAALSSSAPLHPPYWSEWTAPSDNTHTDDQSLIVI